MFEESTPIKSTNWKPHSTFAADMGLIEGKASVEMLEDREAVASKQSPSAVVETVNGSDYSALPTSRRNSESV